MLFGSINIFDSHQSQWPGNGLNWCHLLLCVFLVSSLVGLSVFCNYNYKIDLSHQTSSKQGLAQSKFGWTILRALWYFLFFYFSLENCQIGYTILFDLTLATLYYSRYLPCYTFYYLSNHTKINILGGLIPESCILILLLRREDSAFFSRKKSPARKLPFIKCIPFVPPLSSRPPKRARFFLNDHFNKGSFQILFQREIVVKYFNICGSCPSIVRFHT